MSERDERREGGGWRSWIVPVVASACVVFGLSAIEAVSLPAALIVAGLIVVGGIVALRISP